VEPNDVVELVTDLPDEGLAAGAVGTVVHVFDRPNRAYEVEFADDDGRTIAQIALTPDKVRPAG
jgi:hypothetical protein